MRRRAASPVKRLPTKKLAALEVPETVISAPNTERRGTMSRLLSSRSTARLTALVQQHAASADAAAADARRLAMLKRVLNKEEVDAITTAFFRPPASGQLTVANLRIFLQGIGVAPPSTQQQLEALVRRAVSKVEEEHAVNTSMRSAAHAHAQQHFPPSISPLPSFRASAEPRSARRRSSFRGGAPPALSQPVTPQIAPVPLPTLPATLSLDALLWMCRIMKDERGDAAANRDAVEAYRSCADEATGSVTVASVRARCHAFDVSLPDLDDGVAADSDALALAASVDFSGSRGPAAEDAHVPLEHFVKIIENAQAPRESPERARFTAVPYTTRELELFELDDRLAQSPLRADAEERQRVALALLGDVTLVDEGGLRPNTTVVPDVFLSTTSWRHPTDEDAAAAHDEKPSRFSVVTPMADAPLRRNAAPVTALPLDPRPQSAVRKRFNLPRGEQPHVTAGERFVADFDASHLQRPESSMAVVRSAIVIQNDGAPPQPAFAIPDGLRAALDAPRAQTAPLGAGRRSGVPDVFSRLSSAHVENPAVVLLKLNQRLRELKVQGR